MISEVKLRKIELSRVNTFMPLSVLSTVSLPSVQTVPNEVEVVMRDWIKNFRPV